MKKYLKQIAQFILKDDLNKLQEYRDALSSERDSLRAKGISLEEEKKKLENKIKRMQDPEHILLSYYRVDNVDPSGFPPSYLDPQDPNTYVQRIGEIESVYRSGAFRELVAWALNFHANISVTGKIKDVYGNEIDISSQSANDMIRGIRSIWELVVGAHIKDKQISKNGGVDKYELMGIEIEDA